MDRHTWLARVLRPVLYGALAAGMSGCYEIHEEVWIRDDGSVRYALDYAVPEFLIISMTQVDGGNADSALAQMRRPPAMVVEGDSVWNRDFLDRDLRHFVSERQIPSIERWLALAGRGEAREDSVARHVARRDSLARALTKETPRRFYAVRESLRQMEPESPRSNPNPLQEMAGYVLGAYEAVPDRDGTMRIRHLVFPQHTRAGLVEQRAEGDTRPSARMLSGRTYSYRLHAGRILSAEGAVRSGDGVEWSFPMTSIAEDSARTLEAVILLGKGQQERPKR